MAVFRARRSRGRQRNNVSSWKRSDRQRLTSEALEDRRLLALIAIDPAYPQITYDNGGTTAYTAASQDFTVNARPLQFTLDGSSPFALVTNPRSVTIAIKVDNTGALIGGTLGNDLVITGVIDVDGDTIPDYAGTLLTGEIKAFGYQNEGLGVGTFDFVFEATGGQLTLPTNLSGGGTLSNFYDGKLIYMAQTTEPRVGQPSFVDFTTDFTGNAKGTEGPVWADVAIVKTVDHTCEGVFDQSGTPIPLFDVTGGPVNVTYHYAVTNTGSVDLIVDPSDPNSLVDVNDNSTGPDISLSLNGGQIVPVLSGGFNVGDLNANGKIDGSSDGTAGETWQYTATVALANPGFNNNEVTVEAMPINNNPNGLPSLEPIFGTSTASDDLSVYLATSGVGIEKRVNSKDANSPPFDHVLAGSTVNYTYLVTNQGNVDLDIAQAILDGTFFDDGGPDYPNFTPTSVNGGDGFNIGDTNKNGILDAGPGFVGESWEFEWPGVQLNNAGPYTNNVSITLGALDEAGNPLTEGTNPCVVAAGDTDPATIIVEQPAVTLEKEVVDPECIANIDGQGDVPLYQYNAGGTAVPYRYTIDNTGTTTLLVNLTDVSDNGTPLDTSDDITTVLIVNGVAQPGVVISGDDGDGLLDPTETWTVTFTASITAAGYVTNQGELDATPTDDSGTPLTGFSNLEQTADAAVFMGFTGVQIEKRVNSQDANVEPPAFPSISSGGYVNYSYLVTNTGNVILNFTSLLDDMGGVGAPQTPSAVLKPNLRNIGDANDNGKFDPGESWEFEKLNVQINAANTAPDLFINTATVQAVPVEFDGTPIDAHCLPAVQDSDIATVRLTPPGAIPSLSGYVWNDCNNNGVFDANEQGIGNVTIQLFVLSGGIYVPYAANPDELTSNVPGSLGYYEFSNLPAGTYRIVEIQPVAYFDGKDTIGPPNVVPGGVDQSVNDQYSNIVIPPGANVQFASFNFGEITPSSLSGCTYVDVNNNGVKDPGETDLAGVKITLSGNDDLGNPINQVLYTDMNGEFKFDNLRPADANGYTLTQEHPVLFLDGKDSVGTAGGVASNPQPDLDTITEIKLEGCTDATGYCFGERGYKIPSKRPYIFTNGVWQNQTNPIDVNADGQVSPQDALAVIDSINRIGMGLLPEGNGFGYFPDTNGDSALTPADVLKVLDEVNRQGTGLLSASSSSSGSTTASAKSTISSKGAVLADVAFGELGSTPGEPGATSSTGTAVTTTGSSSVPAVAAPRPLTGEELLSIALGLSGNSTDETADDLYDSIHAGV